MKQHAWTLTNGLSATFTHLPHLHSVSVSVAVRAGRRHESPQVGGISHFLEHMLFRGSQKFPTLSALAGSYEESGGTLDGETWRDHTLFTVSCHPTRLSDCLATLSDMLFHPRLEDIEREKPIVLEEILAERDAHQNMLDLTDLSRSHIWANSALGAPICGEMTTIKTLTQQSLVDHHNEHYVPANMSIALAGAFSQEEASASLQAYFGHGLPASERREEVPTGGFVHGPRGEPRRFSFQNTDDAQLAVQVTFSAYPAAHPLFIAQVLVASILDDGYTTRLPQALSGDTGLVYDLETGLDCYSDAGLFDVLFRVSEARLIEAFERLLSVLKLFVIGGAKPEELARAQCRALFELDFRVDEPETLSRTNAPARLFGLSWRLEEERCAIQNVDHLDLATAIKKIFTSSPPHLCVVGPRASSIVHALQIRLVRWTEEITSRRDSLELAEPHRTKRPPQTPPRYAERAPEEMLRRSAASRSKM